MDWKKIRVLVLDGDARQSLPVLKGLADLGCYIATLNTSKLDFGYTSRYPNEKLIVPQEYSNDDYYSYLKTLAETGGFDVILPLSDRAMDIVTLHSEELRQYVRLPIPDRHIFLKAYNKQLTMEICMDHNIPCPITKRTDESIDEIIDKVGFPLIAKPRIANGSKGLKIVYNRNQLENLINSNDIILDEYVIQEFIPQTGKQYNIHLFSDGKGTLADSLVTEKTRWYPVYGGGCCLCRTIKNTVVQRECTRLLEKINWRSYCEVEMILDPRDGIPKVMEINGRTSASIKIMELAGINVAEQMLQLAYELPITSQGDIEEDVRLRSLFRDILWFIESKDRFTCKPSWFSMKRTYEVLFSVYDPVPFFSYMIKRVTLSKRAAKKDRITQYISGIKDV